LEAALKAKYNEWRDEERGWGSEESSSQESRRLAPRKPLRNKLIWGPGYSLEMKGAVEGERYKTRSKGRVTRISDKIGFRA